MSAAGDLGPLERLAELAGTLSASWAARARACTTAGQERAILRMFGVAGIDRSDRPLAAEVVDGYVGGRPDRLAGGLVLPFAAALVEYDMAPLELARDIASGAIDLALEAEVLRDPGRRRAAEDAARRLAGSALERIDANRVARLELLGLIGDAERPWVGAVLDAPTVVAAAREARALVRAGVDAVRVDVPPVRELTDRLQDAGVELPFRLPVTAGGVAAPSEGSESVPVGSQRGLAELRQALDAAAAERRAYARLATAALPLAAPEQALVAAFERVDVVLADPVAEILDGRVDPDRALADHAFAQRVLARAGATVLVGPGPLVVAPDLARGVPSDATTRAGRALALQLVGAGFARSNGLPADRLFVGALPGWLLDERDPAASAIAQVVIRRELLPGHPLAFEEPDPGTRGSARWPAVLDAVLPLAGSVGMIVREARGGRAAEVATATRAADAVGREVSESLESRPPRGIALELARATVAAAVATLERLAGDGWPSVLGEPLAGPGRGRLGADAVVERSEAFDPFAAPAGIAGLE